MQPCAFCGSVFPDNARFCGQCGRAPVATLDAPTALSRGQARPVPKKEVEEEEERQRRAFLLDLSFSPGGGGQPGVGHVPMVQGTPQMSGVPTVQGTPSSLRVIGSAHKGLLIALAGLVVIVASGITLAVVRTQTSARPGTITEFSVPTVGSTLSAITAGPDGNLWFTENIGNQIGRITPGGAITEFPVPTSASGLTVITAGPDGNLWFIEYYANQIGRITPGGTITEFPAPTSDIEAITKGPDGNLWFTEYFRGIGRITPAGKISEFSIPTVDSGPTGITAGPDGNLWFTQHDGMIGRITLSATISEFPLPTAGSSPTAITAGPDGNLWFIDGNKIGLITPGGKITGFSAPADPASDASGVLMAGLVGTFFPLIQSGGPH
jgi:streptogramin lyase